MSSRDGVGDKKEFFDIDDFQSIDLNIDSLVERFVLPIDKLRSKNSPLNEKTARTTTTAPKESRAHTFYRMLGLPVIGEGGKFYSPGYNPHADEEGNKNVADSIPEGMKEAITAREQISRNSLRVFDIDSSRNTIYALCLGCINGGRSFMPMNREINALENYDEQKLTISERKSTILRYTNTDGTEITNTEFYTVRHILRPFTVDPVIEENLSPIGGSSSVRVAAPFLDTENEYEPNLYAPRPGIEFILRLRLLQQSQAESNAQVQAELNLEDFESEVSNDQQREIAAILTAGGVYKADIEQALNGSTELELYTLNDLVKMYKGLIFLYDKNIEIIEDVYSKTLWSPFCNSGGPERGTVVNTSFLSSKSNLDSWDVTRRIKNLKTKSAIAKKQVDIGEDLNYSDFTIPEFQNVLNVYTDRLEDAKAERDDYEAQASNALRTIEFISGEVSGLGLIDIVAIYMAMWSVPVSVLLGLIDDQAAIRLSEIKTLEKVQAVKDRANKSVLATEAYEEFEKTIINILQFAQSILKDKRIGSDVVRSNNEDPGF